MGIRSRRWVYRVFAFLLLLFVEPALAEDPPAQPPKPVTITLADGRDGCGNTGTCEEDRVRGLPAISADGVTLALPFQYHHGVGIETRVVFVQIGRTDGESVTLYYGGNDGGRGFATANARLAKQSFRSIPWAKVSGPTASVDGIDLSFKIAQVVSVTAIKDGKTIGNVSMPVARKGTVVEGVGIAIVGTGTSYAYVRVGTPGQDDFLNTSWLVVNLSQSTAKNATPTSGNGKTQEQEVARNAASQTSSARISSISESKTLASLSKGEIKQYCQDVWSYQKRLKSSTDASRFECGRSAAQAQFLAKSNDAAACKKKVESCLTIRIAEAARFAKKLDDINAYVQGRSLYGDLLAKSTTFFVLGHILACVAAGDDCTPNAFQEPFVENVTIGNVNECLMETIAYLRELGGHDLCADVEAARKARDATKLLSLPATVLPKCTTIKRKKQR